MTFGIFALVIMTHFALFLGSAAFSPTLPDGAECGVAASNISCGKQFGINAGEMIDTSTSTAARLEKSGNFGTQIFDFVSGVWGFVKGAISTVFGLMTFNYSILQAEEGSVGSGAVSVLVIFFRVMMSALQTYVVYKVTMTALGRG